MSIETDLLAHLAAAVPATLAGEFYAERAPDNAALPFGVMTVSNQDDMHHVGGTLSALKFIDLEFEAYGANIKAADALGGQLLAILNNFTGTVGSTRIEKVSKTADFNGYDDPSQSYYRTIQLVIGHR